MNLEKKLIDGERGTGWVFLVEYGNENKSQTSNKVRVDYREVLNEQEFAFFDHLRQVRKTIAEKNGVPVYAVFTNEQLAGMVKKPPKTIKDVFSLPGVGEARVKQFGEAFVKACLEITEKTDETSG
ncbi:MAG: HRDC domain-containing protein [Spirochaetota bacterium]|nr:HRDC domain-containing protein [Spirochaetota bacterium]